MRPNRHPYPMHAARADTLRIAYAERRAIADPVRIAFAPDTRTPAQREADRLQVRGILARAELAAMLTPEAAARVAAAFAKARR